MTSHKFGRFLTPLPLLCHTLLPLCHIMPNPLPPSWRDVIYHPRFTAFNKRLQMIIDKNNFLSVAAESLSATVVGVQNWIIVVCFDQPMVVHCWSKYCFFTLQDFASFWCIVMILEQIIITKFFVVKKEVYYYFTLQHYWYIGNNTVYIQETGDIYRQSLIFFL